jgi:hypothetical protein
MSLQPSRKANFGLAVVPRIELENGRSPVFRANPCAIDENGEFFYIAVVKFSPYGCLAIAT